jgi:hypothetical protein
LAAGASLAGMAIARFKALCIDAVEVGDAQRFWSQALGLTRTVVGDESYLAGARPEQTLWINAVPEPVTVKNRVHLDVSARSLDELMALGAVFVEQFERWTVMTDLDGQQFCAFLPRVNADGVPEPVPEYRLKDLVVDSRDPSRIARWWHSVLGGTVGCHDVHPWWWLSDIAGTPFGSMDFVEVPEAKTAKNRVHWDVEVDDLQPLVHAGARVLRPSSPDRPWTVLADPDGNEFCAFGA